MKKKKEITTLPPNHVEYHLESVLETVAFTQQNKSIIKKEFQKLQNFYIEYPDAFIYSLQESKNLILQKEEISPTEEKTIKEIDKKIEFITETGEITTTFYYKDALLLDSIEKIYDQIKPIESEKAKQVGVLFYDLEKKRKKDKSVRVGEFFKDGTLNTNSRLSLNFFWIDAAAFYENYITFYN